MSLEVEVPVEINDYKEKIIFGLSLRQLCCFALAIAISIASYYFCTKVLGWTMDETSYVIILEAMPLMAFGFIQQDGQPFEVLLKLRIRHRLGIHKLPAFISVQIDDKEREKSYGSKISKQNHTLKEAVIFFPTKKSCKSKRKKTRQKIKAAKKEYRAAKLAAKKASKEHRGTKKCS